MEVTGPGSVKLSYLWRFLSEPFEKPFFIDRFDDARIDHRRGVELEDLGTGAAHLGENCFHPLQRRIGHVGNRVFQVRMGR
jgi:hypothetical protein